MKKDSLWRQLKEESLRLYEGNYPREVPHTVRSEKIKNHEDPAYAAILTHLWSMDKFTDGWPVFASEIIPPLYEFVKDKLKNYDASKGSLYVYTYNLCFYGLRTVVKTLQPDFVPSYALEIESSFEEFLEKIDKPEEAIDEYLRNNIPLLSREQFLDIVKKANKHIKKGIDPERSAYFRLLAKAMQLHPSAQRWYSEVKHKYPILAIFIN